MCKVGLAANELQRLSSLYCVNLSTEVTSYTDMKMNVWSCLTIDQYMYNVYSVLVV